MLVSINARLGAICLAMHTSAGKDFRELGDGWMNDVLEFANRKARAIDEEELY